MGSESGYGWWQRLLQRSFGLRRGKRNGELGSDPFEALARQTDFEVEIYRQVVYDEDRDIEITIEYVCTCGMPVVKIPDHDSFSCLHCDKVCLLGLSSCSYCFYAMQDRNVYDEDEL